MNTGITCYLVKQKRSPYWHMRYTLPGEKEHSKSLGVRDERTAKRKMEEFLTELERDLHGVGEPSKQKKTRNADLESVLREYLSDLAAQNCAPQYIEKTGLFIRGIAKSQGWKSIREITAEGFTTWRSNLAGKRAAKTLNLYLGAMLSFLNWLVNSDRLKENPLRRVPKAKDFEQKRPRRACTDEEATRLLAVAPAERRLIYLIALHTGLRRSEIASLQWRDVNLDEPTPFIRLRAKNTKNRTGDTVWLHPELIDELRAVHSLGVEASALVVRMFPRLRAFRKDLEAANIPFEDEFGVRFDLHSARKTFNTRMATNGVPTRAAMHAMRHSEEKLTTVVYTQSSHLAVASHIATLPRLLKTNQVSAIVSGKCAISGNTATQADTLAVSTEPTETLENQGFSYDLTPSATPRNKCENGSGGWDRTNDLVINSHPLCR
jgi:integrase